ncbi:GNAT family N-acetyltransferase [Luteococcus sp.]|uniref:GNAT family N-acetyltransferase n=1 Tax=Luteococcus sp. TaxID=1969402 RepID=UPI0037367E8D
MDITSPRRVSLRQVKLDGTALDLVGDLVLADDDRVVVLPAGRGPVEVPRSQIRAMRWAPARVVRPTSRVDDLVRLAALGLPGDSTVRMGGWALHVGQGRLRRANSCHATGTAERELGLAVEQVDGFYRDRGLVPCIQLAARSWHDDAEPAHELDQLLEQRGWAVRQSSRLLVGSLAQLDLAGAQPDLVWEEQPSMAWCVAAGVQDEAGAAELATAPARYATLRLGGETVGGARLVRADDWAELGELFISPEHRGRGHGRALAIGVMASARELGAAYCHVTVPDEQVAAGRLVDQLGLVQHHWVRHREPVS